MRRDSRQKGMGSPLENFYEFVSGYLETISRDLERVLVGVTESEQNVHLGHYCVARLDSLSGFLWHQRTPSWSNVVAERAVFSKITIPSPGSLILKHPSIFSFSAFVWNFTWLLYIPSLVRCGSNYPWKGSIIVPLVVLIIKKILERQQMCRAWRHTFSFWSWAQRTAENQKVGEWQRKDWSHGDKFYQLYSSV